MICLAPKPESKQKSYMQDGIFDRGNNLFYD